MGGGGHAPRPPRFWCAYTRHDIVAINYILPLKLASAINRRWRETKRENVRECEIDGGRERERVTQRE